MLKNNGMLEPQLACLNNLDLQSSTCYYAIKSCNYRIVTPEMDLGDTNIFTKKRDIQGKKTLPSSIVDTIKLSDLNDTKTTELLSTYKSIFYRDFACANTDITFSQFKKLEDHISNLSDSYKKP